jgi:hypothetical protein
VQAVPGEDLVGYETLWRQVEAMLLMAAERTPGLAPEPAPFNEYGVQIMTPAYEGDPEQPKVVPKEQWWSAPARPASPDAPGASRQRPG